MVIKHGGDALGLSQDMPSFGDALKDSQTEGLVQYAKSLANHEGYPPGELNLILPLRTKKAFPEDEVVWKLGFQDQEGDDVLGNTIEVEKRFGKRWQAEVALSHELEGSYGKFEEIETGLKYAAYFDLEKGLITSIGSAVAVT